MKNSKTIEIIRSFTSGQMKRLADFIQSPYFNKQPHTTLLFDYLATLHPALDEKKTTKEQLLKALPQLKGQNELPKRLSHLRELTEKFLAMEAHYHPFDEQLGALKAYDQLQLHRQFDSLNRKMRKELSNDPFRDYDHAWRLHLLEETCFQSLSAKIQRHTENNIDRVMDRLDEFYLGKKFRYLCEAANRKHIINAKLQEDEGRRLLKALKKMEPVQSPFLFFYAGIYEMLTAEDISLAQEVYYKIKHSLQVSHAIIPPEYKISIYNYCINFCINGINTGNVFFLEEYLNLILMKEKGGLLLDNGKISPHEFKNMVTAASKLGQTGLAETFIHQYENCLPEAVRERYVRFGRALVAFYRKAFETCDQHLRYAMKTNDLYFNLAVKSLALRSFYCQQNMELDHQLEAYQKYIHRHKKELGGKTKILLLFHHHLKQLSSLPANDTKYATWLDELQSAPYFPDKDWLEKMAKEKVKRRTVRR